MKKIFWVIIIGFILIFLFSIKFFGISIGFHCGYWHHSFSYEDDCKCIGMKTGGCDSKFDEIRGLQCDAASTECLGIRKECFRIFYPNQTKEIISCEDNPPYSYYRYYEKYNQSF